jgi:hypothetical protein
MSDTYSTKARNTTNFYSEIMSDINHLGVSGKIILKYMLKSGVGT